MKKLIIAVVLIILIVLGVLANNAITSYSTRIFYLETRSLMNNVELDIMSGKINLTNDNNYVLLSDTDYKSRLTYFDTEKSFVIYKEKDKQYIFTVFGKDKYEGFSYINISDDTITEQNIVTNETRDTMEIINENFK